jgi:hypothetical protein
METGVHKTIKFEGEVYAEAYKEVLEVIETALDNEELGPIFEKQLESWARSTNRQAVRSCVNLSLILSSVPTASKTHKTLGIKLNFTR